jgi:membrane-associated HD superfamily phosphohydrolase
MLINFPLFLISFAIYNMIVFLTPGVSWGDTLYVLPMQSGATWTITFGDALIAISLVFLFFEVLKATKHSARSLFDHLLSTIVFIGALVEFLLVKEAATSIFAILLVIALIDVLGGWSVSVRTARRDLTVEAVQDNQP